MTLVAHLAEFAAALRHNGIRVGVDGVVHAVHAIEALGPDRRDDVRAALRASLLSRHDQRDAFDALFDHFFRVRGSGPVAGLPSSSRGAKAGTPADAAVRRRGESIESAASGEGHAPPSRTRDASGSASAAEQLRKADFATLAPDRIAEIRRHVERLRLLLRPLPVRRHVPDPRGRRVDLRATLRVTVREGGVMADLRRRAPRRQPPPLIVLCDVSGSMRRYSEVLLGFVHAAARDLDEVRAFVFGTRLTDITRSLAERAPDAALARIADAVDDYAGGTRIGASLGEFNRRHARRVSIARATVLLITDGLERGDPDVLAVEAARLRRSCRRLVWLNPLLRHDGFEPLAAGIRALLPQADDFLPVHNLASLERLADVLATNPAPRNRKPS